MKYKVGDKVRVRKDLEVGKDYGKRAVVPEMTNLAGMISTIKSVGCGYYELEEDIDLFDWTDEMIEGLWEECGAVPDETATVENFKKQQNKYKLIDVLNKMVNGELKYNTKIIWDEREYTYKGDNEVYRKMGNIEIDLWNDMCMDDLESECELIELDHFTDNTKIEELIDWYQLIDGTTDEEKIHIVWNKLNDIIRKLNKED